MPRPPKRKSLRQNRERKDLQVAPAEAPLDPPPAPPGLLPDVAQRWADFWSSPLAFAIRRASDIGGLTRLFRYYDDLERHRAAVARRPTVKGSKGQPVLNPRGRAMPALEKTILALEDRYGFSPMAALKLGIEPGDGAEEDLDDLSAEFDDVAAGGDDPRLTVLAGKVEAEEHEAKVAK